MWDSRDASAFAIVIRIDLNDARWQRLDRCTAGFRAAQGARLVGNRWDLGAQSFDVG